MRTGGISVSKLRLPPESHAETTGDLERDLKASSGGGGPDARRFRELENQRGQAHSTWPPVRHDARRPDMLATCRERFAGMLKRCTAPNRERADAGV